MPITMALLRGINVGGNKKIKMADLRALFESLGWTGAKTLLQTGNVVFDCDATDQRELADQIEAGIERQFGFHVDVIIRSHAEFSDAISRHPFSDAQLAEPGRVLIMFLAAEPTEPAIDTLREAHTGPEALHIAGPTVYLYYPDGAGRSKLTHAVIARKLGITGTARNWNTVQKLLTLAAEFDA